MPIVLVAVLVFWRRLIRDGGSTGVVIVGCTEAPIFAQLAEGLGMARLPDNLTSVPHRLPSSSRGECESSRTICVPSGARNCLTVYPSGSCHCTLQLQAEIASEM